ncbi:MAG: hypothetical protein MUF54_04140 [Polyangiaceae bacterium]|jgi:hypothetical protein|nr:hypothetical protein [Polyangiaceae bacterium]
MPYLLAPVGVLGAFSLLALILAVASVAGAVFRPTRIPIAEAHQAQRLSLGVLRRPSVPRLTIEPLDATLRAKGFHECNPHDALGLGPYAPGRPLTSGKLLIPKRGGHTQSHGYDVLVHFHGQRAARIYLTQTALGVAFVGIDVGEGSGPYEKAFQNPGAFPALLASIEAHLQHASGDSNAHIRHLGLTAWSAGYGAIKEILKQNGDKRVDAVVLLDGLHASWNAAGPRGEGVSSANAGGIKPIFDFAKKAVRGEKLFVLTHSDVDPVRYPSTALTADLLLRELNLKRYKVADTGGPHAQTGAVDVRGFHVWSYRGRNELAHCDHLRHISQAVRDVLEAVWRTPPMEREPGESVVVGHEDATRG